MPLLKPEYEAVLPDLSVIEVTGRQYYTKLGGFGQSHFLGEKVPIVEQRAIGYQPDVLLPQPKIKSNQVIETEYYSGTKPLINLAYSPLASGISHVASKSGESIGTYPTKPAAYLYVPSAAPSLAASYRTPQSIASYKTSDTTPAKESIAPSEKSTEYPSSMPYSSSYILSSIAPSYKTYATTYKPSDISYAPIKGESPTYPSIPPYASPYSPMPPSKYTPSQGPSSPSPSGGSGGTTPPPPTIPPPPLPKLGGLLSGGGGLGGARKRTRPFMEILPLGLDIGGWGRAIRGRRPGKAVKRKAAAPAKGKSGRKKKR